MASPGNPSKFALVFRSAHKLAQFRLIRNRHNNFTSSFRSIHFSLIKLNPFGDIAKSTFLFFQFIPDNLFFCTKFIIQSADDDEKKKNSESHVGEFGVCRNIFRSNCLAQFQLHCENECSAEFILFFITSTLNFVNFTRNFVSSSKCFSKSETNKNFQPITTTLFE